MAQKSLLEFGSSRPGAAAQLASARARHEAAAEEARRLGLPWGSRPRRRAGRPGRPEVYREVLVEALRAGRAAEVSLLASADPPAWWRPAHGFLLQEPEAPFAAANEAVESVGASSAAAPEAAETVGAEDEEEELTPSKRRKKHEVPRPAQEWFLRWGSHMMAKHGYNWAECWRLAVLWCPEVFEGTHKDTFRRWQPATVKPVDKGGRPCKLTPPQLQKITVMTHSLVKHGTPFGLEHLTALINKVLLQEEAGEQVSKWWTHRFLHALGLRRKVCVPHRGRLHTPKEQEIYKARLLCKLVWLQRQWAIPAERVFNADETGVFLLPVADRR